MLTLAKIISDEELLKLEKENFSHRKRAIKLIKTKLKRDPYLLLGEKRNLLNLAKQLESKNNYGPLAYYWSKQVTNYLQLKKILFKNSHQEEQIFDYWTTSDFAKDFYSFWKQGISTFNASKKLEAAIYIQLKQFFTINLGVRKTKRVSTAYRPVPEIGDYVLGKKISTASSQIPVCINSLMDSSRKLTIFFNPFTPKQNKQQLNRIISALEVIKTCSPDSYQSLFTFTQVITPMNLSGIVSYSSQDLPGYSSINMFERDFVDLVDDLLHENGHHHLNHYLNISRLIIEKNDLIYYSPWRKALRPLRGIYHAYFTFFWALKIFNDIIENLPSCECHFTKKEIGKIHRRFLEEFVMLDCCWPMLNHAYQQNLISSSGMLLMAQIKDGIEKCRKKFGIINKKTKKNYPVEYRKFIKLKNELDKNLKSYALI